MLPSTHRSISWKKGTPSAHHRQEPYSAEQAIAGMDAAGVDRALIHPVLWDPGSNQLAVEAVRKYPDRFAIMGWFYLDDPNGRNLVAHWKERPPRPIMTHDVIGSSSVDQIGKVLREIGVRYISEVLLQLSHDLPLRGRVERVIELPERVRRSYEYQAVELVAGSCLIQCPCDLVDEVPFVGPVQIFTRLQRVVSRICTLVPSARPLHAELVRVTVDICRNELAVGVERVLRIPLLHNAGTPTVRDDIPSPGMFHASSPFMRQIKGRKRR